MTQQLGINRPSVPIYLTSLLLALVAVAGWLLPVPFVTERAFWIAIAAYAVLALGVLGVLVFEISIPSKRPERAGCRWPTMVTGPLPCPHSTVTHQGASMARLGDMHLV